MKLPPFLQSLQKLVDVNIHHLVNITYVKNESSKEKISVVDVDGGKRIEVNRSALEGKDVEQLGGFLKGKFEEEGVPLIEVKAMERVSRSGCIRKSFPPFMMEGLKVSSANI